MDEYTVLCDGAIRALLDGGPGASDLPERSLTAPDAGAWWHGVSPGRAVAASEPCLCGSGLSEAACTLRDTPAVRRAMRELSRASWASDEGKGGGR